MWAVPVSYHFEIIWILKSFFRCIWVTRVWVRALYVYNIEAVSSCKLFFSPNFSNKNINGWNYFLVPCWIVFFIWFDLAELYYFLFYWSWPDCIFNLIVAGGGSAGPETEEDKEENYWEELQIKSIKSIMYWI